MSNLGLVSDDETASPDLTGTPLSPPGSLPEDAPFGTQQGTQSGGVGSYVQDAQSSLVGSGRIPPVHSGASTSRAPPPPLAPSSQHPPSDTTQHLAGATQPHRGNPPGAAPSTRGGVLRRVDTSEKRFAYLASVGSVAPAVVKTRARSRSSRRIDDTRKTVSSDAQMVGAAADDGVGGVGDQDQGLARSAGLPTTSTELSAPPPLPSAAPADNTSELVGLPVSGLSRLSSLPPGAVANGSGRAGARPTLHRLSSVAQHPPARSRNAQELRGGVAPDRSRGTGSRGGPGPGALHTRTRPVSSVVPPSQSQQAGSRRGAHHLTLDGREVIVPPGSSAPHSRTVLAGRAGSRSQNACVRFLLSHCSPRVSLFSLFICLCSCFQAFFAKILSVSLWNYRWAVPLFISLFFIATCLILYLGKAVLVLAFKFYRRARVCLRRRRSPRHVRRRRGRPPRNHSGTYHSRSRPLTPGSSAGRETLALLTDKRGSYGSVGWRDAPDGHRHTDDFPTQTPEFSPAESNADVSDYSVASTWRFSQSNDRYDDREPEEDAVGRRACSFPRGNNGPGHSDMSGGGGRVTAGGNGSGGSGGATISSDHAGPTLPGNHTGDQPNTTAGDQTGGLLLRGDAGTGGAAAGELYVTSQSSKPRPRASSSASRQPTAPPSQASRRTDGVGTTDKPPSTGRRGAGGGAGVSGAGSGRHRRKPGHSASRPTTASLPPQDTRMTVWSEPSPPQHTPTALQLPAFCSLCEPASYADPPELPPLSTVALIAFFSSMASVLCCVAVGQLPPVYAVMFPVLLHPVSWALCALWEQISRMTRDYNNLPYDELLSVEDYKQFFIAQFTMYVYELRLSQGSIGAGSAGRCGSALACLLYPVRVVWWAAQMVLTSALVIVWWVGGIVLSPLLCCCGSGYRWYWGLGKRYLLLSEHGRDGDADADGEPSQAWHSILKAGAQLSRCNPKRTRGGPSAGRRDMPGPGGARGRPVSATQLPGASTANEGTSRPVSLSGRPSSRFRWLPLISLRTVACCLGMVGVLLAVVPDLSTYPVRQAFPYLWVSQLKGGHVAMDSLRPGSAPGPTTPPALTVGTNGTAGSGIHPGLVGPSAHSAAPAAAGGPPALSAIPDPQAVTGSGTGGAPVQTGVVAQYPIAHVSHAHQTLATSTDWTAGETPHSGKDGAGEGSPGSGGQPHAHMRSHGANERLVDSVFHVSPSPLIPSRSQIVVALVLLALSVLPLSAQRHYTQRVLVERRVPRMRMFMCQSLFQVLFILLLAPVYIRLQYLGYPVPAIGPSDKAALHTAHGIKSRSHALPEADLWAPVGVDASAVHSGPGSVPSGAGAATSGHSGGADTDPTPALSHATNPNATTQHTSQSPGLVEGQRFTHPSLPHGDAPPPGLEIDFPPWQRLRTPSFLPWEAVTRAWRCLVLGEDSTAFDTCTEMSGGEGSVRLAAWEGQKASRTTHHLEDQLQRDWQRALHRVARDDDGTTAHRGHHSRPSSDDHSAGGGAASAKGSGVGGGRARGGKLDNLAAQLMAVSQIPSSHQTDASLSAQQQLHAAAESRLVPSTADDWAAPAALAASSDSPNDDQPEDRQLSDAVGYYVSRVHEQNVLWWAMGVVLVCSVLLSVGVSCFMSGVSAHRRPASWIPTTYGLSILLCVVLVVASSSFFSTAFFPAAYSGPFARCEYLLAASEEARKAQLQWVDIVRDAHTHSQSTQEHAGGWRDARTVTPFASVRASLADRQDVQYAQRGFGGDGGVGGAGVGASGRSPVWLTAGHSTLADSHTGATTTTTTRSFPTAHAIHSLVFDQLSDASVQPHTRRSATSHAAARRRLARDMAGGRRHFQAYLDNYEYCLGYFFSPQPGGFPFSVWQFLGILSVSVGVVVAAWARTPSHRTDPALVLEEMTDMHHSNGHGDDPESNRHHHSQRRWAAPGAQRAPGGAGSHTRHPTSTSASSVGPGGRPRGRHTGSRMAAGRVPGRKPEMHPLLATDAFGRPIGSVGMASGEDAPRECVYDLWAELQEVEGLEKVLEDGVKRVMEVYPERR